MARSTLLRFPDGTTRARTVAGFAPEEVRPFSKRAELLLGKYDITTVHSAPYAAMTVESLRAVAIANWNRPDDAMMVTSKEEMQHDLRSRDIFDDVRRKLCWFFWILFLILTIIFGIDPDDARAFVYNMFPFHDKTADEFAEEAKGKPTGTIKGAAQQVTAQREILQHAFTVKMVESEKVDDVFLVGADVEDEFYNKTSGVLARVPGAICVEFGDDAMKLSHPTVGRFAGAYSRVTKKAFLYTPGAGLKLITPMLSMTNMGYGFGQSGPLMWTHGYIAAFEIAAFVLRTKMQPVPVIFEDSLWRGVEERQKSEALAFQASKEDALREGREWVSRHQQWAAKRVETMREKPAPSDAPLRPDGTPHPNALSAAAAKGAAKGAETKREKSAPSDAPLRPDGTPHPNALSAAVAKGAETKRKKSAPPGARARVNGSLPTNALEAASTQGAATHVAKVAQRQANADAMKVMTMRAKYVGTPAHTDPESYWNYKYLDLSGNEKVYWPPLPRSQIEWFYTNGLLTEDILVRPFVELYHAPYVTIGKMVACGWAYPGPA